MLTQDEKETLTRAIDYVIRTGDGANRYASLAWELLRLRDKETPQPIATAPIVVTIWLAGDSQFVYVDSPGEVEIKFGYSD